MKKYIASLLLLFALTINAQENVDFDALKIEGDSIVYNKNTKIEGTRIFTTDLKEKYKGKDFEYKEDTPVKKQPVKSDNKSSAAFLSFFSSFMTSIFPFLLGGFVVFVILKIVLDIDARFWKKKSDNTQLTQKLIYEDEDIQELNLDNLLKQAIDHSDFRLAIRYYYLSTLKKMTDNEIIDYHKDKTNSEYLFEIENKSMRTNFSYLSYVYSYVWYGEFPIDKNSFKVAENKYQSFLKTIV